MEKKKETKPKKKNYLFFDFVRITSAIPGLIWLRPKVIYESENAKAWKKGGVLMIANHISYSDPIYLMASLWQRRHHFVCIKDFFNGKFLSWLFSSFHCIPIDRQNFSMESLHLITEELKADHLVTMFPEGRRVKEENNNLAPFKSGMVLISLKSGKPIVPVYVKRPKHLWNRLRVCVGEPVDVKVICGGIPSLKQLDECAAVLMEKEQMLQQLCEGTAPSKGKSETTASPMA